MKDALVRTESTKPPLTFAELMAPTPVDEFLGDAWGKEFRHISGWKGKFTALLPWSRLNRILRRNRLEPPRLRLALDGKIVPPEVFVRYTGNRKGHESPVPRLLPTQLTEQLYQGAALILDAVDELHEPLMRLAESLERFFRVHVQMNLYAGWKTSRGFDLHWDDHEVLILQLTGRKHWKVYRPTRPYPVRKDLAKSPPPDEDPVWDAVLENGDLLYIPRGWWHVAIPLAEPTMHITIGVPNPTGADLLKWLAEQLLAETVVRKDLPRFADEAEQQQHLEEIRSALFKRFDRDLLARFFERWDAMAAPHPRFSLPWSVMDEALPPEDSTRIEITAPRPLRLQRSDSKGEVEFSSMGKRWRFDRSVEPVLELLKDGRMVSIEDLCRAADGSLDRAGVRKFLGELIVKGLAAIVDDDLPHYS
jgi:hypothetical protein